MKAAALSALALTGLFLSGCADIEGALGPDSLTRTTVSAPPSTPVPSPVQREEVVEIPTLGQAADDGYSRDEWLGSLSPGTVAGIDVDGCWTARQERAEESSGAEVSSALVCDADWTTVSRELRRDFMRQGWVVTPGLEYLSARRTDATAYTLVRPVEDRDLGLVLVVSVVPSDPVTAPASESSPGQPSE